MLVSSARLAIRGARTVLGRKYDLRTIMSSVHTPSPWLTLGKQAASRIRTITSSVHSPCAWSTLGLKQGASRGQIKRRYFELAKQTHPDTQAQDEAVSFLAVFAAYEKLITQLDVTRTPAGAASGQASSAGTCQAASRKTQPQRRGRVVHREKTRGEVLCHRLLDDPHAALQLWETICSWQQPMEVTSAMLEELFKVSVSESAACAHAHAHANILPCGMVSPSTFR